MRSSDDRPVRLELLIGAAEFWTRARGDIAAAANRVLIQAMTFEGDAAGSAVAQAIRECRALDRRVLVDDYTRLNINDRSLGTPAARRDFALQAEVQATDALFKGLVLAGIPVRITNRVGRLWLNYPCRNHKKLIVADGVAYLGGVNFSDHNFDWPDLMLRIEHPAAADFLAADFRRTWEGRAATAKTEVGGIGLIALDGRSNGAGFSRVFQMIASARREITVVSPYLTAPFTDALGCASRRGVAVQVVTPWLNNKPIVRDALFRVAGKHGFEMVAGPSMSHLKGLLIDGERLVVGSSNFDFASLAAEEEFLVIVSDLPIIKDFTARVIAPALAQRIDPLPSTHRLRDIVSEFVLRLAAVGANAARAFRRSAVDWPA